MLQGAQELRGAQKAWGAQEPRGALGAAQTTARLSRRCRNGLGWEASRGHQP